MHDCVLRANGQRLWSRLMAMGEVGATPKGGCNRQALTDADLAGRKLFTDWCEAAGCDVRVDAIGNIFARRRGRDDALPVVMTGSHLDTQPTGGKFDGIYGVLAGLEVIESLNDAGIQTRHPLEVVAWCNEEGCRFPTAMMGSAVWAGRVTLAEAHALADGNGITVRQELHRAGIATDVAITRHAVRAAFELHIEQGPVLEREQKTIGVVSGVQHMSRHEVIVEGQEAHAGPTPMELRQDPVRALSDMLPALYAAVATLGRDSRLTIGIIETLPGSNNTVPGRLRFTLDLRHPDALAYAALKASAYEIVQSTLTRHRLRGQVYCFWEAQGVVFDPGCVAAVRTAVEGLGYSHMEMVSGAGHDSCNVAAAVPTSMIFIPCAGGLSHNEAESAVPADIEAGANVLLYAMRAHAD